MTQYAYFDHTQPEPQRVLGWLDTDALDYGENLPASGDLLELSPEQWADRMTIAWAVQAGTLVPLPPPPETADQVLVQKIALGIAISSLSSGLLSCTMAIDGKTMAEIGSVARDAASGLGFPMGLPTFTYPDITGSPKTFNQEQLVGLYQAQRNLIYNLNVQASIMRQGGIPNWPEQTAVIP